MYHSGSFLENMSKTKLEKHILFDNILKDK